MVFTMNTKKAIYTAIFGDKDELKPISIHSGYENIVFTDNKHLHADNYTLIICPKKFDDPTRNARYTKVMAHELLSSYHYSLWVDANIQISATNLDHLFSHYLEHHDIAVHQHPIRNCTFEEAERCIEINKDNPAIINKQMQNYRSDGYPVNHGLVSTGLLFRRHTPITQKFNSYWWQEIENHSRRDQLSFNYVAWKHNIPFHIINGHVKLNNVEGFQTFGHKLSADHRNW